MELPSVITDPFDWPATMPELRTIDNLLRCGICCEFLNIAMILPKCSHNYCSQCIRRYMNYKSQCPACNTPTIEGEIRNNKVVDEIVKNFVLVRPAILKLCKGQGGRRSASCSGTETPTRHRKDDKKLAKSAEKASSLTPGTALAVKEATKYFTSETPKRPSASPSTSANPLNRSNEENISPGLHVDRADDGDDDVIVLDDFQPAPKNVAVTSPSTSKGSDSKNSATRSDKSDCPVCGVPVAVKYINSHLDACLKRGTEQPRNPTKQNRNQRRKALPKLVYNIMSDRELRKKLKEYKLATQGTRKELVRRLQEYTVLYNAQCDSDDPVPVDDVIKYHERMEKIRSKPPQKSSAKAFRLKVEKGQDEKTIIKSQQEYLKHHNQQFDELIRSARERMKKSKLPTMDGVAGTSTVSSTAPASETSEENCSKTEQGAASAERIHECPSRGKTQDEIKATLEPSRDESSANLSANKTDLEQAGKDRHLDLEDTPLSHMKQTMSTSDGTKTVAPETASVETVTKHSNLTPREGNINEDLSRDECVSITTVTTDEESSMDEPHSPTLFDNLSFDGDFQEEGEGREACPEEGQTMTADIIPELMGSQKNNISEEGGKPVARSSDHPSTRPSDDQTSPVFNGAIHRSNTPTVGSASYNSAPASPSAHQSQTNQVCHEAVSSRGRLRRKRKTALEQLDVDFTNNTEGEHPRRASKRNKKSIN